MRIFFLKFILLLPLLSLRCTTETLSQSSPISGYITVDNIKRTYLVNLPPGYTDTSSYPLVLVLHGGGGSAAQCERDYGWTSKVPYAGGTGIANYRFSSADSTLWALANHCQDTRPGVTKKEMYTRCQWNTCDQPIVSYITQDGGHPWPGGIKPWMMADTPSWAFNATNLIRDFFKKYQL